MDVLIIEDELTAVEHLQNILAEMDSSINVMATIDSVTDSVDWLKQHSPDLIFMDINLSDGNSFSIFDQVSVESPIIFTTAYDEFAIKAFEQNSVDYLLKPIEEKDVADALKKVRKNFDKTKHDPRLDYLLKAIKNTDGQIRKLGFPTLDGIEFVTIENILRCESDEGYTDIYMVDNSKVCTTKKLKELEELLHGFPFFRTHRSFLINLNFIKKYQRGEGGGIVIMEDGCEIPVSRRKKAAFLEKLSQF
ncbi:MAG: LytTR family DNA-binding domain-containing protein [Bacteroidota bacterium]